MQLLLPDEPGHVVDKMFFHDSKLNLVTLDHGRLTLGVGSRPSIATHVETLPNEF